MRIRKKFDYNGIPLLIVEREEAYLNAFVTVTRIIAPNGGTIPVKLEYRDTLKKIQERTASMLDSFAKRGANIEEELTKAI